jgi:hypothetical protein
MASTTGAWWQMGCQAGAARAAAKGAHCAAAHTYTACTAMQLVQPAHSRYSQHTATHMDPAVRTLQRLQMAPDVAAIGPSQTHSAAQAF